MPTKIFKLIKHITTLPKLFYYVKKINDVEDYLIEKDFKSAKSTLQNLDWSAFEIEVSLLTAECMIRESEPKEAVKELAKTNAMICGKPRSSENNYKNFYCLLLVEKASGEKINRATMHRLYDSIDFSQVKKMTKRLFPIKVLQKAG